MENELAKIRPHTSSGLLHQRAPANLLSALEATFKEQNAERTPAAYFGGLLTALEGTIQKEGRGGDLGFGEGDLLPAELYLLSLVAPFVPPPIVRHHLHSLLSLTSPLWPVLTPHAPPLRSQLSLYHAIFRALDRSLLEDPTVRQSFITVLHLCVDSRPKVRRRAVDLVRDVLASPPSPLLHHPYSDKSGEFVISTLSEVTSLGSSKQKGKRSVEELTGIAIHLLAFLRSGLPYLPSTILPTVTTSLLSFPKFGNPYLSDASYGVLADLLSVPEDPAIPRNIETSTLGLLKAVLGSPPVKTDTILVPSWLRVVGQIMVVYASKDSKSCDAEVLRVWKLIFSFLETDVTNIKREATNTLESLTRCLSQHLMDASVSRPDAKTPISQIIGQLTNAVSALAYVSSLPEIFSIISALTSHMRYRPHGHSSQTVAELLLLPLMEAISDLRLKKGFQYKDSADGALKTAMIVMGPEVLLSVLPLNLEPEDRAAGREARAYLLPLLIHNHPSPLKHFISYFVPLTEHMFDLQQKADAEGRASEAKVWSVLVSQIWAGLPGYCYRITDLQQSLSPQFAQLLSQLLYNQPDLRPPVLKALKVIVSSNIANPDGPCDKREAPDDYDFSDDDLQNNLQFLKAQSESWLAVLFNVYSSVSRDGQGAVGEVISIWASIADQKSLATTCQKVLEMLKSSLSKIKTVSSRTDEDAKTVTSLQDILVLLVPFLSGNEAKATFKLCLASDMLKSKDNGVQKRAYKLVTRLTQSGKISINAEELFNEMDDVSEYALSAAKKDRMVFLMSLLSHLDKTSLHIIPTIVSEAVLGTKEPSEKARSAAFDLIVSMGRKMAEGGVVKRANLDGMEEDNMSDATASLQEYFMMLAGGLAGASPHMISATITAISRLVFEFKGDLSSHMLTEIFVTILVYVSSANREIVKSALGFVKLAVITLPVELLRPHLSQLVGSLLNWSHDHKNHFKDKVKHIFERMIRRFGWNEVFTCASDSEDGKKVLLNIKKRKDKAKRRKAHTNDSDGDDEGSIRQPLATGDAFEDVLYGSDSDLDLDNDAPVSHRQSQKKGETFSTRLRLNQDEPMDLLDGANTNVVSGNPKARRKVNNKDSGMFKTSEESGKMIIDGEVETESNLDNEDVAGAAYHEQITSADGFTRGSRGQIKFNKDTKKRRRADENGGSDVDMTDAGAEKPKKVKRKSSSILGQEFRTKRAGGDVKRGGVDPYAYLSLSQAAKGGRGRGGSRLSVTGKR